jgi:drug/metabolite transporter (DMT)-like permease
MPRSSINEIVTPRTSFIALHLAILLFGVSGLIGKTVSCPALVVACLRSLIGALSVTAYLYLCQPQPFASTLTDKKTLIYSGVLLAAHWWSFFASIQLASVAIGLLTYASYPLFVILLDCLRTGDRPQLRDAVACTLVVIGLACVLPDWNFTSQHGLGIWVGLVSGLTFAILTLLNRKLTLTHSPLTLVAAQTGIAGLLLLPMSGRQLSAITGSDWLWLGLLGVVFTGFAHSCFVASLTRLRVAVVGVAMALEPVYGLLAAWLWLGETYTPFTLLGAGMIVAAASISFLPTTENPTSPPSVE